MIEYKRLRINVENIRGADGVLCDSPNITWVTQPGLLYPCIGETYIEVEAIPNEDGYVEFFVQCEDCGNCPPTHIKRALCDDSSGCADCEKCDGGWCVPICPDKVCVDNTCMDCETAADCPTNKECLNGECVCPPNKPFVDERGYCVACLTSDNCGPCATCVNGDCVAKDCGTGACNPATDECVECMNSGDCDGPNECCVGNECDCCSGFVWDYDLNQCVKQPDCYTDSDCATCTYCDNGDCFPVICPEGYTCVDNDCVKLCDCYGGECPPGYTCNPYGDVCICVLCEGDCVDSTDCDDGCYCGSLNTCLPSPCQGSCDNAADCGPGCGCLNGQCVPCASVDCSSNSTNCSDIVGCGCEGNNCKKTTGSGCSGGCVNFLDCGPGCTCYNGECVPCSWFSCSGADCANQPGCECSNNTCADDPDSRDCLDEFTITKDDDDCDLIIELSGSDACACSDISAGAKIDYLTGPISGEYIASFYVDLRKGSAGSYVSYQLLHGLNESSYADIADNEEPTAGTITISVQPTYYELVLENGNLVRKGSSSTFVGAEVDYISSSFNGVAYQTMQDIRLPEIGYVNSTNLTEVKSVKVTTRLTDDLVFPNGCTYSATTTIGSFTYNVAVPIANNLKFAVQKALTSEDERYPMFTIYKSTDGTFSDSEAFRKVYVAPETDGSYKDTLLGLAEISSDGVITGEEGELWGNRYYYAKNDCACDKTADFGKLVFCNPSELNFSYSGCNTKITLEAPFSPCTVNQDITQWNVLNGYTIPTDVQTKYDLYINGNKVATYVHKDGAGMVAYENTSYVTAGETMFKTLSFTDQIEKVELKINYDDLEECTLTYTNDSVVDLEPVYEVDCPVGQGNEYYVRIPKSTGVGQVANVSNVTSGANPVDGTSEPNYFIVTVPKGTPTDVKVYFSSPYEGCYSVFTVTETCCDVDTFYVSNVLSADSGCNGDITLTASVAGGSLPLSYSWAYTDQHEASKTKTGNPVTFTAGTYGTGVVTLTVTDKGGCTTTYDTPINTVEYDFDYSPTSATVCGTDSVTINLTGKSGGVVEWTDGVSTYNATLIGGAAQITKSYSSSGSKTITFNKITVNGCDFSLGETVAVTVVDDPNANVTLSEAGTICSGDTGVELDFSGTANGVVKYNHTYDGATTYDFSVNLGATGATSIAAPLEAGSHTITLTSITAGSCTTTLSKILNYTVVADPTITFDPNSYVCTTDATQYSVEFEATNVSGIPTANYGTVAPVSGSTYRVSSVPSNVAVTITAVNGGCSVQATSDQKQCDCDDVAVPVPVAGSSGLYEYCSDAGAVPTMSVTVSSPATTANWYDQQYGGTLKQALSLSYQPTGGDVPLPGNFVTYWVEAQTGINCVSERVPVIINNNSVPEASSITWSGDIVDGNTVRLWASSVTGCDGCTYQWSVAGGTSAVVGSSTNTDVTILLGGTVGTTVTATLTLTNPSTGCDSVITSDRVIVNTYTSECDYCLDAGDGVSTLIEMTDLNVVLDGVEISLATDYAGDFNFPYEFDPAGPGDMTTFDTDIELWMDGQGVNYGVVGIVASGGCPTCTCDDTYNTFKWNGVDGRLHIVSAELERDSTPETYSVTHEGCA